MDLFEIFGLCLGWTKNEATLNDSDSKENARDWKWGMRVRLKNHAKLKEMFLDKFDEANSIEILFRSKSGDLNQK